MAEARAKSTSTRRKSNAAPATTSPPRSAATPLVSNDSKIRQTAELLKQLSDPTRLFMLMLLSEQERNVTELCAELGSQSQPAVSHHLSLLRHGRLIEPRRQGKHNIYHLTENGRQLSGIVQEIMVPPRS